MTGDLSKKNIPREGKVVFRVDCMVSHLSDKSIGKEGRCLRRGLGIGGDKVEKIAGMGMLRIDEVREALGK